MTNARSGVANGRSRSAERFRHSQVQQDSNFYLQKYIWDQAGVQNVIAELKLVTS